MTSEMPKVKKADETRKKIVAAALDLFAEKGYEQATMRLIAQRAGVSTGNAYYYFTSKEELIQGYYEDLLYQFADKVEVVLAEEGDFSDRLIKVLCTWVDNARPFHDFAGTFFRYAADPTSSLSPFSKESEETRMKSIDLHRRLIDGSGKLKMAPELRSRLPELLWLYQMGMVLYWVHDASAEQANTKTLITKTAPLIDRFIGLSRLPLLRGTTREFMELIDELTKPQASEF